MAKKKTLAELNSLVENLAQQYREADQELNQAIAAMGNDQESRDRVKTATAAKQKVWVAYGKAKKQQLAARQRGEA